MNELKIKLLIELIDKNPIIWNGKNMSCKDPSKKISAWKHVAKKCGIAVATAKKKWKGLRIYYYKELNKQLKSEQSGSESSWKYWKKLDFITKRITRQRNSSERKDENDSARVIVEDKVKEEEEENLIEHNSIDNSYKLNTSAISSSALNRPMTTVEKEFVSTKQPMDAFMCQIPVATVPPSSSKNEDDCFCSLLAKLSRFPLQQKNEAKIAMMQIVCGIEKQLDSHNVVSNSML